MILWKNAKMIHLATIVYATKVTILAAKNGVCVVNTRRKQRHE